MHLLIPAAGMGRRMGGDRNKLFLSLRSQPLITWTLLAAEGAFHISWVGIIARPADWSDLKEILAEVNLTKPVQLIQGGATRQESVYNGLQALPLEAEQVLIHDGARCLCTPTLLDRCAEAIQGSGVLGVPSGDEGERGQRSVQQGGEGEGDNSTQRAPSLTSGLIAAVPVKDTIKVVDETGLIQSTPDRRQLWAAQTPQAFDVQLLKQCHAEGRRQGWEVTDDAALFEKCGLSVRVVEGEETNLKLTTPADVAIAEFILQQRLSEGSGYES